MIIPPFSIVLTIFVFFGLYKNRSFDKFYCWILSVTIVVIITQNLGYFICINSFEITHAEILTGIVFVLSIINIIKTKKISKCFSFTSLLLVVSIAIGIFFTCVLPTKTPVILFDSSWDEYAFGLINMTKISILPSTILLSIRLVIYITILLSLKNKLVDKSFVIKLYSYLIRYIKFFVIIFIIEVFFKQVVHSNAFFDFTNYFYGVGINTASWFSERGLLQPLQGLNREPSYQAITLFFYVLLFSKERETRKYIYVCLILLLISMSFSSLIFIILTLVLLLITSSKFEKALFLFTSIILIMGIGIILQQGHFDYYFVRMKNIAYIFESMINGNSQILNIASEDIRLFSIFENFKLFLERPFFGHGLGTVFCFSAVVSMLSELGLITFILWIKIVFFDFISIKITRIHFEKVLFCSFVLLGFCFIGSIELIYNFAFVIVLYYFYS